MITQTETKRDEDEHRTMENEQEKKESKAELIWDSLKRSPLHTNAHLSSLFELNLLARHYHPSVQSFALHLINNTVNNYSGDPVLDFSTIAFLDKFVFRNPKKQVLTSLTGQMFAKPSLLQRRLGESGVQSWLKRDENSVAEDEKFFYLYFKEKSQKQTIKKQSKLTAEQMEQEIDGFADQLMEKEMRTAGDPDIDEDDEMSFSDDSQLNEELEGEMYDRREDVGELSLNSEEVDEDDNDGQLDDEALVDEFDEDDSDGSGLSFVSDEDSINNNERNTQENQNVFAAAEEFADILAQADDPAINPKQSKWEQRVGMVMREKRKNQTPARSMCKKARK